MFQFSRGRREQKALKSSMGYIAQRLEAKIPSSFGALLPKAPKNRPMAAVGVSESIAKGGAQKRHGLPDRKTTHTIIRCDWHVFGIIVEE
jgi:hypothetical protein